MCVSSYDSALRPLLLLLPLLVGVTPMIAMDAAGRIYYTVIRAIVMTVPVSPISTITAIVTIIVIFTPTPNTTITTAVSPAVSSVMTVFIYPRVNPLNLLQVRSNAAPVVKRTQTLLPNIDKSTVHGNEM